MSLTIIDTGCANLASVKFAFERLDASPIVSDDIATIQSADRLVLPGVGAAPYALQNIARKNLTQIIRDVRQPLLGICLGMQLFYQNLYEGETISRGLGIIPGDVKRLDTSDLPSPHMGWNELESIKNTALLSGINAGDYAYFVHSYAAPITEHTIASCDYGTPFTAVTRKDNFMGCQFHPERSSKVGAQILKNFLELKA